MAFIAVTRLRVRSLRYMPAFVLYAARSASQARKSSGNLDTRFRRTQGLTFWTFTAWADQPSMEAYRSGHPHRQAMPKLRDWCDEASVAHWSQPSDALPGWDYATNRMAEIGRLSKVSHPSPMQRRGEINLR